MSQIPNPKSLLQSVSHLPSPPSQHLLSVISGFHHLLWLRAFPASLVLSSLTHIEKVLLLLFPAFLVPLSVAAASSSSLRSPCCLRRHNFRDPASLLRRHSVPSSPSSLLLLAGVTAFPLRRRSNANLRGVPFFCCILFLLTYFCCILLLDLLFYLLTGSHSFCCCYCYPFSFLLFCLLCFVDFFEHQLIS